MPHHRRDAGRFFECNDDVEWSFTWICHHLPFDPEWLKETILAWVSIERAKRQKEKIERRCGYVASLENEQRNRNGNQ